MEIKELSANGHERLVSCEDGDYHGLIAIHNCAPWTSNRRFSFLAISKRTEAIVDVLRLARGDTRNAWRVMPFGGGKSIILKNDGPIDREKIFRTHGRFVETFGGRYILLKMLAPVLPTWSTFEKRRSTLLV